MEETPHLHKKIFIRTTEKWKTYMMNYSYASLTIPHRIIERLGIEKLCIDQTKENQSYRNISQVQIEK